MKLIKNVMLVIITICFMMMGFCNTANVADVINLENNLQYMQIENTEQFIDFFINHSNEKAELITDFDCQNLEVWVPKNFSGKFDGKGHVIKNLKIQ